MARSRSRTLTAYRVTSWLVRAGLAAAFLLQALVLADSTWAEPSRAWASPTASTSVVFGLLEGLRYLSVVLDMLGAALLFVPGCTAVGALLLSGTAFVTLFAHVFVLGGDPIGPLLLFFASAALVGQRRRELVAIWRLIPVPTARRPCWRRGSASASKEVRYRVRGHRAFLHSEAAQFHLAAW